MAPYKLQKYNGMQSRHRCPQCQSKGKTFTLYLDMETGQPLAMHVGKCDRLIKCGYHYTPRHWFADNGLIVNRPWTMAKKPIEKKNYGLSTIDYGLFNRSLKRYERNHLISYLKTVLGADVTDGLIEKYRIGTAKHWPGATVFWQIALNGDIRAGKIMLYNATTGKRIRQPLKYIAWVHNLLPVTGCGLPVNSQHATHNPQRTTNFKLDQCLFGEHLLAGHTQPAAIVESEKTALIASVFMPQYVWLATGSVSNLSVQKCRVLAGRKVYLFPDLNAYKTWQAKLAELRLISSFTISNLLQIRANECDKADGLDIADFLLREMEREKL